MSTSELPSATDDRRSREIRSVLALGMLAGLLLSPKLWLTTRSYPLAPVADFWPVIRAPYDMLCYILLVGLCVALLLVPWQRLCVLLFVVAAVLLSMGDQNRWQPWFYQYLLMLAALSITRNPTHGLNACRFVMVATYFWSGVQKCNATFPNESYVWLLEPFKPYLPDSLALALADAGIFAPIIEIGIAVGLLLPPFRPFAITAAIGMHAYILTALGPLGHNWNTVVWPWNLAMMLLLVRLFGRTQPVTGREILGPPRSVMHLVVLLLFGLMPLFSFWGLWDSYLSVALYSDNTLKGTVMIPKEVHEQLSPTITPYTEDNGDGSYTVYLYNWCYAELNVPSYPAHRVYHHSARGLGRYAGTPTTVYLVVRERPNIFTGKRETTVTEIAVE